MDNRITCNYKSPQFLGRVDSTVFKYVKNMKAEAKKMYVDYYRHSGMKMNPKAAEIIDKRCDYALDILKNKAQLMHKDTIIKTMKNPRKSDSGVYLCAENKNLLQEWEQKGAAHRISVYDNDLRKVNVITDYDAYISRFESFVERINPDKLDLSIVRTSISNLWNLSRPKMTKGNYAVKHAESTQKVANDIGYSTTFINSFKEHIKDVRKQLNPNAGKDEKMPWWERITGIFNTKN